MSSKAPKRVNVVVKRKPRGSDEVESSTDRPTWCPPCYYERLMEGALTVHEFHELTAWAGALYEGVPKDEIKAFVEAVEAAYWR